MDLVKQISVKTAQCDELRHENAGLRERLAKAEASSVSRNTLDRTAPAVDKQRPPTGHWLIGDSLLRYVDAVRISPQDMLKCIHGGHTNDIIINFSKNRKREPAKSPSSSEPMTAPIRMKQT